ncbi:hypothetical protein [Puerhibacterium sp. TATVAM-FAB25]
MNPSRAAQPTDPFAEDGHTMSLHSTQKSIAGRIRPTAAHLWAA